MQPYPYLVKVERWFLIDPRLKEHISKTSMERKHGSGEIMQTKHTPKIWKEKIKKLFCVFLDKIIKHYRNTWTQDV